MLNEIKLFDKCVGCYFFVLTFNGDKDIEGIAECRKYRVAWEWPRDPSITLRLSKIDSKYHRRVIECCKCMTSEKEDGILNVKSTVRNINGKFEHHY